MPLLPTVSRGDRTIEMCCDFPFAHRPLMSIKYSRTIVSRQTELPWCHATFIPEALREFAGMRVSAKRGDLADFQIRPLQEQFLCRPDPLGFLVSMNLHPHAVPIRVLWRWYQSPFGS